MAGKVAELQQSAAKMVKDPRYQFFDFEGQFNDAAYRVINFGNLEGAYFIFQMNTQLFPNMLKLFGAKPFDRK